MADRHDNDSWMGLTKPGKRTSSYSKKRKPTKTPGRPGSSLRAEKMDRGMPLTKQRKRK